MKNARWILTLLCTWSLINACNGGSSTLADTLSNDASENVDTTVTPPGVDLCKLSWTEALPAKGDISDLQSAYTADQWWETILAVLERAFPFAKAIVADSGRSQADYWMNQDPEAKTSFDKLWDFMGTLFHEDIHDYDDRHTGGNSSVYVITTEKKVTFGQEHDFPARAIVAAYTDPDVKSQNPMYKLYFTDEEQTGMTTAPFTVSLDELNAYTHNELYDFIMTSNYQNVETTNCGAGLLFWMYITEVWLKALRTDYDSDYQYLLGSKTDLEAVLTLWSRARWVWTTIRDMKGPFTCDYMKADKDKLIDLVEKAENLREIESLRDAYCK